MKKLILLLLFLLFFYNLKSQELFIFGEDNFKSSKTISYGNLDVLFLSKSNNKAFVALTMDTHRLACSQASISHNPFFAAPLILFLENSDIVRLDKRVGTEFVGCLMKVVFNISSSELEKLKRSNIHTIKYRTKIFPEPVKTYELRNRNNNYPNLIRAFYN